jgi:hypothetical protein
MTSCERWVLTVDEEGVLTLPPDLLEKTGWTDGTLLQWEHQDDGLKVSECPIIPQAQVEDQFDFFFERAAEGETFVILCDKGQKVLFTPATAKLTSLTKTA